ncbi:MAG: DUF373 family protein [Thermoplasmata archaeon]
MRLVVCVDRDDDLGRKAGVNGPVIGRANVVDAAMRLGTADPEDADTNAMFAAVRLYDEIVAAGDTCEVVILTGDARVGLVSDRKVSDQFDQVIKEHPPSSAHLVSDGAEDEFLFPILASRVRIDGVRRVFIRQNASIESTYYTLVRALKDPKLRAKTVLPFALMMLTLGIAAAAGVIWWGVIGLLVLLGIYLIFWTFDIDEALIDSVRSASTDIRQGSVAFGFGLFAIALVGIGFLSGYNVYVGAPSRSPLERILFFANYAFIWWVIAGVIWEGGRAIRRYLVRGRFSRTFPIATTSIIGLGFLGYGIVYLVEYLENIVSSPGFIAVTVGAITLGLILVISAGILQLYLRYRAREANGESFPT